MENIRNRTNITLVKSDEKAVKMNLLPNYEKRTIFSKNLVAVHMKKTKLIFNKPVYGGACILDLSKT